MRASTKYFLGWFLSFGLFSFLLILSSSQKDWLRLQHLVVSQNSEDFESEPLLNSSDPELVELIEEKLTAYLGTWLWRLPLAQIQNQVLDDVQVASVKVHRLFPNKLSIEVQKRSAILGLVVEGGVLPVASDGTLLAKIPFKQAYQFPLLKGQQLSQSKELRKKVIDFYNQIPREGLFSQDSISEIQFTDGEGYRMILNQSQMQVFFLDEELGRKASRVEKVLRYLESESIKGRVIDARLSKKVVVRLRNDS